MIELPFNSEKKLHKCNYLHVITGPMFAGKTDLLIKKIIAFREQKYRVLILKPDVDHRFSHKHIVSHSQQKELAVCVEVEHFQKQINSLLKENDYDILAIDEFHFFEAEVVLFLDKLLDKYTILVSGLNKGVLDNNLEAMNQILSRADYIDRLNGKCQICQGLGTKIQPVYLDKKPSKKIDFVGGAEKYRLLCRKCFKSQQN